MSVTLNPKQFHSRLSSLAQAWASSDKNDDYENLRGVDCILIPAGDPAEDAGSRKSSAFQTWLLAFEFPSTIIALTKKDVYVLTSPSKVKILNQLLPAPADSPMQIHLIARSNKDSDAAAKTLNEFVDILKSCKRIATLTKEQQTGKLTSEFAAAFAALSPQPDTVDCSAAFSAIMAVKDEEELKYHRLASRLSSHLFTGYLIPRVSLAIDKDRRISHETLAAQLEDRLGDRSGEEGAKGPDMKLWSTMKGITEEELLYADVIFTPIIQSGGKYDMKTSAESNADNLTWPGVILASVGLRYKGYCSTVGRTICVNASKVQTANYKLLLELEGHVLSKMKDGVTAREVYNFAAAFLKERSPGLETHLTKSIGFGTGIEFRDTSYLISPKNGHVLRSGMVLCLNLGLQNLVDEKGKPYALLLSDTVKITSEKAICLTEADKAVSQVFFELDAKEEERDEKPPAPAKKAAAGTNGTNGKTPNRAKAAGSPVKNVTAGSKILRGKTRGEGRDVAESTAKKIAAHQKELHENLHLEGLEKYQEAGDRDGKDGKATFKRFASYKGELALPKEVDDLKIHVDRRNQTVILPVSGYAVPYHINTIKNASKSDEGDFTYLRINFQTPGQLAGRKEDTPFENPDATFIRSVTYRSADGHRFDGIHKSITDLKKEVTKLEAQKKDMADVVDQDSLVEIKGKRASKLPEVFVRPAPEGKRVPGDLEIHQNGLRYHTPLGHKTDILFSNIRHLFFQPCDHELIVLIHLHLKSPIMIGKKKTKDVQFYREASDVQFDETGNRKRKYRYGDEDELEQEEQDKKRKQQLNKEFNAFADKIADTSDERLDVDIPYRELGFEGVPFRTNVKLQPTQDCLVHLSDPPFLVLTLADVELAHLERVQFGLKQFDMVFVFHDYKRTPAHINSIPMTELDNVKEWLNSVDIAVSEGPVNLQWGPIMKVVNEDPYEFFKEGGWGFLVSTSSDESGSEDDDTASEFHMSEDEFKEESSSDDEESDEYAASDAMDDDASAASEDDEASENDWDELERKAARADKRKQETGRADESDDEDDRRKKKPQAKGKGKR